MRQQQQEPPSADGIEGWFAGRLPDDWFEGAPEVVVDRDEVLVVGRVPRAGGGGRRGRGRGGRGGAHLAVPREHPRAERMAVAREAEHRYGRNVAWGAQAGSTRQVFTSLSVPVMTRLRQPERQVLDTLVAAGVARSRSEALAWSVRLVGQHADEWLGQLRDALQHVEQVRTQGPS